MKTANEIARVLYMAWFNIDGIAAQLDGHWIPKNSDMSITECLNKAADVWARDISTEIHYSDTEKVSALASCLSGMLKRQEDSEDINSQSDAT